MKFQRIACVDNVNLTPEAYKRLAELSKMEFTPCLADPRDTRQTTEQVAGADCLLVSWRTRVDEEVMARLPALRYIGLCASKYTNPAAGNIDLEAARRRGITVSAVGQYGDEATAEFIFCQLLNLFRGMQPTRWSDTACELHGKSLGIIGMGAMGQHVLKRAIGFGMDVQYYSRTRKPESEQLGARFASQAEVLAASDIVSLHVPKGICAMTADHFATMKPRSVLVNTCLGVVFAPQDLDHWLNTPSHFAVMDESADESYRKFRSRTNVIYPNVVAGRTAESRQRLSRQVLDNLEAFLSGTPQNVIN